jgi:hypothetical protein
MLVGFTLESLVVVMAAPLQHGEAEAEAKNILHSFTTRPRDDA